MFWLRIQNNPKRLDGLQSRHTNARQVAVGERPLQTWMYSRRFAEASAVAKFRVHTMCKRFQSSSRASCAAVHARSWEALWWRWAGSGYPAGLLAWLAKRWRRGSGSSTASVKVGAMFSSGYNNEVSEQKSARGVGS